MKKIKWTSIFLLLIMASCHTSRIMNSWKSAKTTAHNYNKIVVLGVIRDADRTMQEKMENHLVGDLKAIGYNAISSLQEYGPKAFEKIDEEEAVLKLKNSGVDAIVTIVLLDKKKERKYIPGNIYYSPYDSYYSRFWGYRTALFRRIYEPGYYVTDTKYFWESNFYDMSTQQLIYSVQTQTFDPANAEVMGHQYGQIIVKDMLKNNILQSAVEK
ncbi:MAG: hypothetical protein ACKVOW_20320 [Chitinophagaceae bacterium]